MPSRLRIARNILANWSGLTASTLVSFLLAPYILHKLGDAGYGVWMLALSLTGYLGLLDLGIRSSVIRFVSSHRAKSEYGSLNQIFNTALLTFSSVGLLAFLIGVAIALSADKLFNIPPELAGQAQGVIILISAMLALNFITGVFSSILAAAERFDLVNLNTLLSSLFRAGLILIIFPFRADLVTLGAVTLVSSLFYLLNIYFAFRHEPNLKLDFKLADRQTLRRIFNYSAFSFIIIISSRVAYYSDNTVIGIFGTAEMITYFAIGGIIVEFLRRFVNAFSTVIMPVASVLDSQGNNASLERLLLAGTKYSLLAILPLSLILVSMGKTLLSVWMGPVYAEKSYIILLILLIPQIYNLSQFAAEEILLGIGRHKFFSIIALAEALSNLVLSIILIKPLGIIGVALGTAIPLVTLKGFLSPFYIRQICPIRFSRYLREAYLGPLLICLPAVLLAAALDRFFTAGTLIEFTLQAGLILSVYFLLAWKLVVEQPVKDSILNRLKGLKFKDSFSL